MTLRRVCIAEVKTAWKFYLHCCERFDDVLELTGSSSQLHLLVMNMYRFKRETVAIISLELGILP
jgi:hypothetical protein